MEQQDLSHKEPPGGKVGRIATLQRSRLAGKSADNLPKQHLQTRRKPIGGNSKPQWWGGIVSGFAEPPR
ncbi:hypothetical protein, partial [Rhizobium leguminosarum]|uniref:hypothetical protein n=1 Tax=Rhizobium leguminosarum TaxID=384 RepID=UPI003F947C73